MGLFGSKAVITPLTSTDLAFLKDWSFPYSEMTGGLKAEFEEQVAHFLAEQRITGVGLDEIGRAHV